MRRFHVSLIVCLCILDIGCTALFTEQKYVLIDENVTEKMIFSGIVFSIPEKRDIRKIVIHGSGKVKNIEIYAREAKHKWKLIKRIKRAVTFPAEIHMVVHADAIRILQKTTAGRGRIDTVKFYTTADEAEI